MRQAHDQHYRSRAAFKLLQLHTAHRIFRLGDAVVDLGAAPGGWSQVAAQCVGAHGTVRAVDVLPMEPLPGVAVTRGDFTDAALQAALAAQLVDVVLSDMAPNLSGVAAIDQEATLHLVAEVIRFAGHHLRPRGWLVAKAFRSPKTPQLLIALQACFTDVVLAKPEASRKDSAEIYLVARRKK